MSFKRGAVSTACLLVLMGGPAYSAVIGANVPAPEMSAQRVAELPAAQRGAWQAYLARSQQQSQLDRAALAAELKPGAAAPAAPKSGNGGMPLDKEAAWYASAEARAVADNIVSFQTPTGGWAKNLDRRQPPRLPGQRYSAEGGVPVPNVVNFDTPRDRLWSYVGTLDNGATTTEARFLARVQAQLPGKEGDVYRASIVKAIRYLLMAQYPNGGWPQNYPLEGGYHDGITFNDNAMSDAATLLADVAKGNGDFAFVPADLRQQSGAADERAIKAILAAQVVVNGKRTGWPQQADALTLAPISARNYEMPSLASAESADILLFLMSLPNPAPEVRAAIDAGVAWLNSVAVHGKAFTKVSEEEGRKLIDRPGAGPIWSRNYDIQTGKPIFGDRDKSIHDDVNGVSKGRRNGYAWYTGAPQKALDAHARMQRTAPGAAAQSAAAGAAPVKPGS